MVTYVLKLCQTVRGNDLILSILYCFRDERQIRNRVIDNIYTDRQKMQNIKNRDKDK